MTEESGNFQIEVLRENLYRHVEYLSVKIGDRHLWKEGSLNNAADYIESVFTSSGYTVSRQTYSCYGQTVSNLIAEKNGTDQEVVIIGAHYDSVPGSPGADDNASAVAGLLELARLHRERSNKKTFVFVAFANEESPCFGSNKMGSMVYAKHLKEQMTLVEVMVSLEMIGFFSKERMQAYPLPGMGLIYPKTGNFIGVVGNFRSSKYVSFFKKGIRKYSNIRVQSLMAPEFFGGINLSDNYAFWQHGYKAVMVTDTSFFRNRNYHQETDTIDSLDFYKMAEAVKGLHFALREL